MDQEDSKMDPVNPLELSSNPLSSGQDEMVGTENPPSSGKVDTLGTENPPSSGKDDVMGRENPPPNGHDEIMDSENPPSSKQQDDVMGTENPAEVSSNSLLFVKDGMMGTANPTEVSSNPMSWIKDDMMRSDNPPSSGKDDETCAENPPELSSNHPPISGKDGMMSTVNPTEVFSNPLSSGKDDMMSTETLPEVTFNHPSSGKDNGKKGADSPIGSSKPELTDNNTPQSLKATSKIVKKSQAGKLKAKKNNGSQQVRGKKIVMTSKKVVVNAENCRNADEKQISDFSELKETNEEPPKGKDEEAEHKMKENKNRSTIDRSPKGESDNSQLKVTDPPEGSSKPELSDKNTPQSLKANSKIVKKSQAGKPKAKKKNNGTRQSCGKRRISTSKEVLDNAESGQNADEKQISDSSQLKETNYEPPKGKSQEVENKVKEIQNRSPSGKSCREKSQQGREDKTSQLDKTEHKQESEEKLKGSRGSRKIKGKRSDMERSQLKDEKGEKLGGFIFMCNAKTKPDCFRYHIMGVTASKKDDVLQIKSGHKLFLYDFDLKLLYGIYKASSSGGMKLEPKAFGGKFPAQVRFKIAADCFPLPESIFKQAIKDNYNENNKFRTELTVRQVRKLTQLFRPVGIHSAEHPKVITRERESPDSVRGSWPLLHRENYNVQSHYRDHHFDRREEIVHDQFRMENHRAYGLPRDRRNVATTSHVSPILESYEGDDRPHHLNHGHLRNVPADVESVRTDCLYLNDSRVLPYLNDSRDPPYLTDSRDPYHAYRQRVSTRDAYLAPLSREEISPNSYLVGGRSFGGTDNLPRREPIRDRHYPVYSAPDRFDHLRVRPYRGDKLEASHAPVSSRYSFAGHSSRRR